MANGRFSMNHMEIYVRDMNAMCAFYTDVLGFKITDQGDAGERRMVFLSRNPEVHHQFVFCTGRPDKVDFSVHNPERFWPMVRDGPYPPRIVWRRCESAVASPPRPR